MKRLIALSIACLVLFIAFRAFAYNPPPTDGYVTDLAGKLSSEEKMKLDAKLEKLEADTKNQVAALILPTLDGEEISDVAYDTAKAWKVGQKDLDNGVLVVIAVKEHKARIETGKGVEGELTDLECANIIRYKLAPHLKKGDFYQGLNDTFDAIAFDLDSRNVAGKPSVHKSGGAPSQLGVVALWVSLVLLIGLVIVWIALTVFIRRRQGYTVKADDDLYDDSDLDLTPVVPIVAASTYAAAASHKKSEHKKSQHRSSYSSSSSASRSSNDDDSWNSGGGGGFDSGGGFSGGGGDFGGGGASGDW